MLSASRFQLRKTTVEKIRKNPASMLAIRVWAETPGQIDILKEHVCELVKKAQVLLPLKLIVVYVWHGHAKTTIPVSADTTAQLWVLLQRELKPYRQLEVAKINSGYVLDPFGELLNRAVHYAATRGCDRAYFISAAAIDFLTKESAGALLKAQAYAVPYTGLILPDDKPLLNTGTFSNVFSSVSVSELIAASCFSVRTGNPAVDASMLSSTETTRPACTLASIHGNAVQQIDGTRMHGARRSFGSERADALMENLAATRYRRYFGGLRPELQRLLKERQCPPIQL